MSTDSRFVHLIWQSEELAKMVQGGVPFPMLSDAGGKIGAVYGVYDEDAGVDIRGRFIIDPDFVIRAMEVAHARSGAQSRRVDPAGQGVPARPRDRRSDAFRLAAWAGHAQAGACAGGQGLAGLETLSTKFSNEPPLAYVGDGSFVGHLLAFCSNIRPGHVAIIDVRSPGEHCRHRVPGLPQRVQRLAP